MSFLIRLILMTLPVLLGVGCSNPTSETAPTPVVFRVMTYNIHHGEGMDKVLDLERIARLILQEKADLVAVQEVDQGVPRTGKRDLPAELAKLTGMHVAFGSNLAFQGGQYGNVILSRYPILQQTNLHYPAPLTPKGEQRGLLQAVVAIEGRKLRFLATHLDSQGAENERLRSVDVLEQIVRASDLPVILAGDFNAQPESGTVKRLQAALTDCWAVTEQGAGWTFPANAPKHRIDYLWITSGGPIHPRKSWVPESLASDHRPVVTELEWR